MVKIRCLPSGLIFVFTTILMAQHASAVLQCTVCAPPCLPAYTVNVFNISDDGSVFIGTTQKEVRCYESSGGTLSNTGTGAYNAVIMRISDLAAGHAQRADYSPNYPYPINLSSSNRILSCGYVIGDCQSSGWQACVASLSEDTNAHVGDCTIFSLKVCCNASRADTTGPVCNYIGINPPSRAPWTNQNFDVVWSCTDPSGISTYNLIYNVTHTDGSQDIPWTLLYSGLQTQYAFTPAANNHTYYFKVNATDTEENTGYYSTPAGTTFDNQNPNITYNITDDPINKDVTISSFAWDNVSGIFNHTINCMATNPDLAVFVQCSQAAPFGGVSACQTRKIPYTDETEISCGISSQDRAGNTYNIPLGNIYYAPAPEHPLIIFLEHSVFMSLGETYHGRMKVRNLKSSPDTINISLGGTYPAGLAKFLNSSIITYMSPDSRNVSVSLNPYEQRLIYVEVVSTDEGEWDTKAFARSQKFSITDSDTMSIIMGFPASFPGMELLSLVMLVIASALFYWKTRK